VGVDCDYGLGLGFQFPGVTGFVPGVLGFLTLENNSLRPFEG
jgi:hypothetical protein